jgi:predicted component of type VI protein secretion system
MRTNSSILDPTAKFVDDKATALTRARYQRLSPIYDEIEGLLERRFRPWGDNLWPLASGPEKSTA